MAERDHILIGLVQEILGPRNGLYEILPTDHNPRDEYITGVLTPPETLDELESDAEIIPEESDSEDSDSVVPPPAVPLGFSPALNPKSQSHSIGLSFVVENSQDEAKIEICATWARYRQEQGGWHRVPNKFLSPVITINADADKLPPFELEPSLKMRIRVKILATSPRAKARVSIFLVNDAKPARPDTPDFVFQPQIRVYCLVGTEIAPMDDYLSDLRGMELNKRMAQEEETLALLYKEHLPKARGHLCGAVWREIDPERFHSKQPSVPKSAPFFWIDGDLLPEDERKKFSPADVRTELIPIYPIEAPFVDEWRQEYGMIPELNSLKLSEVWDANEVKSALQPLADGYRTWIEEQDTKLANIPPSLYQTATRHLTECKQTLERIEEGINLIATDSDVRLAFCFANRAIAKQAEWAQKGKKTHVLTWRPFQLAFILLNIPALADESHNDRKICDLLWFPTGGGKTEAYLGLAAFTLALRRRRAKKDTDGYRMGVGVDVLSRYTLRLLTIQQFRRALRVITACEFLRVENLNYGQKPVGWRPKKCDISENWLWGTVRFSAGLWVGGGVTPNHMFTRKVPDDKGRIVTFYGAVEILKDGKIKNEGEPAQVLNCPCCNAILAIPEDGLQAGIFTLHLVVSFKNAQAISTPGPGQLGYQNLIINNVSAKPHAISGFRTLSINFTVPNDQSLNAAGIDDWWQTVIKPAIGQNVTLQATRASRPGYFFRTYTNQQRKDKPLNFEIFCPNPECELNNHSWQEKIPDTKQRSLPLFGSQQAMKFDLVLPAFRKNERHHNLSGRIPIPAYTIDDQVYHRCPSLVVATVDKFARLAFEPNAGALFGQVEYYHERWGYYRIHCMPATDIASSPPAPIEHPSPQNSSIKVESFSPPNLIIQDELHLIEGPLGSMVGIYEAAIDTLAEKRVRGIVSHPKYLTSTATVRQASDQVQSLFNRELKIFPPPGLTINDNFFSFTKETHPLDAERPGRLYVGICAPGKGAQTPIVRIWSSLLQTVFERLNGGASPDELDQFWTLVGYFNAIRELAGARGLYRQDIPQQIITRGNSRQISDDVIELSSRADSTALPGLLNRLETKIPAAEDAVLTTAMFGTGVDINRLGLMFVAGQPKTTSAYIQATGRVGRTGGGLVITFFRASRPRDLDHYEFFTGYHRALYKYVEPITVAPFSPRARERALGPLSVALLRQAMQIAGVSVSERWRIQQYIQGGRYSEARRIIASRTDPEVLALVDLLEARAQTQPEGRRPEKHVTRIEAQAGLDRWRMLAQQNDDTNRFVYHESALLRPPERIIVLGDPPHEIYKLDVVFRNAPNSLRDVESGTGFKG